MWWNNYGHGWMMDGWGWGMPFGGLLWLVVVALLIAAAVWLVRVSWGAGEVPARAGPRSSALDILNERFARGDIDREEYLQKKRDLQG
jgi:putative membrane protein